MDFQDKQIIGDYDEIYELNIDTKSFTNLDGIEIIDNKHQFISFLKGFTHNMIEIDIDHGWFHIESKTAKFIITKQHPSKVGNIIHLAWQKFWNNNYYDYDVSIYSKYCGQFYKSNEYEIDKKSFYKDLINWIVMDL
jgi:hypothetical protein